MTNTAEPPSRLDRIEAILERVANQQQTNTAAIAQLTSQQAELKQELQDSISHLVGVIGDFVEEAQSDREQTKAELQTFREQAERDRQTFQAEIRRIWEYLLRQGGNGSNPPTS
ncbi:hypothetical protein F7734_44195 [Scytonema sp. UIC 10036]|uniref:hypothetical protein n=1 Tax=Scytonema sp. UIC 10036 TaxID=2304196 RepID=UPI0012DA0873|nr:hypothetical protein [Scytonema sp. UIC 10036]MUG98928.1 hypothetical protein [Scytonema sp. UIC 10036]